MELVWFIKLGLTFLGSLIIGLVAIFLPDWSKDEISRYIHEHLYYFTCGSTVTGTVIASGTVNPAFTNWGDLIVRFVILSSQVMITVTITFFLTKLLKKLFPDPIIIDKSAPKK